MKIFFTSIIVFLNLSNGVCAEPLMEDFLTQYYSSPERVNKNYTKLLYAMANKYFHIADSLLDKGENPNIIRGSTMSPFMIAIVYEKQELVEKMISKGADINLKSCSDGKFVSPLFLAVKGNKGLKIIQTLCAKGVKVLDTPFNDWWESSKPLSHAMSMTNFEKFRIIADCLTDEEINRLDRYNCNLFGLQMNKAYLVSDQKFTESSIEIANYLLERKVRLETKGGNSALACAIKTGNLQLAVFLLNSGADINFYSTGIHTNPLFSTLEYLQECIKKKSNEGLDPLHFLLDLDVNLNFSVGAYSPLSYSIRFNLVKAVELLLANDVDVDIIDGSGKTPLIWAVENNNLNLLNLLLSAGAKPTKPGYKIKNPIELAYSLGYSEILSALIHAEAQMY